MSLSKEQVTRFYETLALLISNREGVEIKVVSVEPKKECFADDLTKQKEGSWRKDESHSKISRE